MTLKELAAQYRETADIFREKIQQFSAVLAEEGLSETEKYRLRARAAMLRSIYRELRGAARRMDNYYEGRCKNGSDEG